MVLDLARGRRPSGFHTSSKAPSDFLNLKLSFYDSECQ